MTRLLRRLVKWFYLLIAIMLILLAILVQSGRSFSYLLADYQDSIASYLSSRLDAKVTIQKINADWKGLKPGVQLLGVNLQSISGEPIADVSRAMLRLDILRSLKNARLVWSDLSIEKINITFQQQDNGFWKIPGLKSLDAAVETNKAGNATLDPLIDMLLLSHHMAIKQSHLQFQFFNGQKLNLRAPNLLLENNGDFHRLALQVDLDEKPRSLYLLLEATGDPRDQDNLKASGYLELNQFPTSEPVQAATTFLLSGQKSYLTSEGEVSAKIWMNNHTDEKRFNLIGKLNLQRLLVELSERHVALDKFSTDLSGYWQADGKWQIGLQSINAHLQSENIQGMNWIASSNGFNQSVDLRLDQMDLEKMHQLLENTGALGNQRLHQVMQTLQPRGKLTNVQISFPYRNAKDWQLAANANQLAVSPWQGAPGLTGVDGYLQLDAKGGFVSIDSRNGFSMFYANVYAEPMTYDRMSGQVAWRLEKENNKIYVNSGALNFYDGEETTSGYMWLSMPWYKNTDNVDLFLQIGSQKLNVSRYKKYIPKTISPKLREWLENSVGEKNSGIAQNIGFVYRATLNNKDIHARSYQLSMDLQDTELLYHPEWPQLRKMSGHLKIDNADVIANVNQAQIYNTQVRGAKVELHPRQNNAGSLLSVNANLQGAASDGLRVLREGALRRYIGNSMDSWFMYGDIQTSLDLRVPLATRDPAQDAYQQVDIDIQSPEFEIQNLNLKMKDLSGRVSYNNKTGLLSENLQATLFNQKVVAQLHSINQGSKRNTRVDVSGKVNVDDIASWTRRPETLFLKGLLPYQLSVELRHNNKTMEENVNEASVLQSSSQFVEQAFAEIKLVSNLEGIEIDLPKPYGKKAKSKRTFGFQMWLQPEYSQIQASYDGKVDSLFRMQRGQNGRLLNANIALSQEAKFASDDGIHLSEFLVSGFMSGFDLDAWKKTKLQYDEYRQKLSPTILDAEESIENSPEKIAGLPFRAELVLGNYELASNKFEHLAVNAKRNSEGWVLDLENPKINGELLVPHLAEVPLRVKLKQLYIQTQNVQTQGADNAAESQRPADFVDPRKLPLANIDIKELFIDSEPWGKIAFDIKPEHQGVLIDNIQGNIRGLSLHSHDVKDQGAQLFWQSNESGYQSRFVGKLTADNMGTVLKNWKKPEMVDSESAVFVVDVNWLAAPQDFHLVGIEGTIDLKLTEGRFHREATAGDGLLRLMSILNFDSLARRLRLDFTDLYKTGLAYDQISGKVRFERGKMNFIDPLIVRSPSSDLQLAGSFNLREETVNARIVANLPVAGNLTFYAALATGLPAAAGVYLVSKIFKKQVSQVASISYTMSGSWEKPKLRFDRLFESEDSLRESVKEKNNDQEQKKSTPTGTLESKPDLQSQPK